MSQFLELVFNLPLQNGFFYRDLEDQNTQFGMRVVAPFGKRSLTGFVVNVFHKPPEGFKLKKISRRVDSESLFGADFFLLANWLSKTYFSSVGEALSAMVPAGRREKSFDEMIKHRPWESYELTSEQRHAIESIVYGASIQFEKKSFSGVSGTNTNTADERKWFYLKGVTGSGKTLVFAEVARKIIETDHSVIYLVPEISLTHQIVEQFVAIFKDKVAVIHSGMTPSQKLKQWRLIKDGIARVVIGARSAVFAPVKKLGLIIIDEEHETSFKSSASPRYHARQVAMHRCQTEGAVLVLGSATPSVEAIHYIKSRLLQELTLSRRPGSGALPAVTIIDMKKEEGPVSNKLLEEIQSAKMEDRQSILFLNRRGFSYFFCCNNCGYEMQCKNCSVSLTYHKSSTSMLCHYCGYKGQLIKTCPECSSFDVGYRGYGTQRIEQELELRIPGLEVCRLDTDTARNKKNLRSILSDFHDGKIDVLVGTQMVAKGLNFPGVKLVGMINADTGLHMPDFRAAERTFNLIVQVSGRAGRTLPDGKVIVQTYQPEHSAINSAVAGESSQFYEKELQTREELNFPPFSRLIRLVFRSRIKGKATYAADQFAEILRENLSSNSKTKHRPYKWEIMGPAECPIERIAGNYRIHILLRNNTMKPIHRWVEQALLTFKCPLHVSMEIDVDPVSML